MSRHMSQTNHSSPSCHKSPFQHTIRPPNYTTSSCWQNTSSTPPTNPSIASSLHKHLHRYHLWTRMQPPTNTPTRHPTHHPTAASVKLHNSTSIPVHRLHLYYQVKGAALGSPLGCTFPAFCMCHFENSVFHDDSLRPST